MKSLILTVGLPRSGKSTWAKGSGLPIVSPDAIRLAVHGQPFIASAEPIVWAIARTMVASLFAAGHEQVILDACNGTKKRRDEWIDERWTLRFMQFPADKQTCIQRAVATERSDIITVIERMAGKWEDLDADEQFLRL